MSTKQFSIHTLFKAVDEMSTPIKNMSKNVDGLKRDMRGMDKIVKTAFITIAAAATGATLAIADFTNEAAKIEKHIVRLSTKFGGNMSEAKKLVGDIQILSAKTPLQFEPLIQASDKLLAYGVAGKDVVKTLRMLGDVAQGDSTKLDAIANAYGRILAEDRVTRKRLQPLVTSGVPIYAALAKVMKTSQKELSVALQKGKVGAKELNKAIELLTSEGGMFFNNMDKQASTLIGRFSTFKDLIIIAKVVLGRIFLPIAKDTMEYMITSMERILGWIEKTFGSTYYIDEFGNSIEVINPNLIKLTENLKGFLSGIKKLAENLVLLFAWVIKIHNAIKPFYKIIGLFLGVFLSLYIAIKAYIGIMSFYLAIQKANIVLMTIINSLKSLAVIKQYALNTAMVIGSTIVKGMTALQWALNAAYAANPVGAVILAIVGLIAVFVLLYNKSETVRNFINALWDTLKGFIAKAGSFKDSIIQFIVKPIEVILGMLAKLPGSAGEAARSAQAKLQGLSANTESTIITKAQNDKAKNGRVDVAFDNAPKGTKVNSTHGDTLGSVELNTGRA